MQLEDKDGATVSMNIGTEEKKVGEARKRKDGMPGRSTEAELESCVRRKRQNPDDATEGAAASTEWNV